MGKKAGLLVPLFSVYSRRSLGIGDLNDLRPLVDFCRKTALSVLQLLPMNETGMFSCPYDSVSSFAIDPVYLSLGGLALPAALRRGVEKLRQDFPAGAPFADYRLKKEKLALLRQVFLAQDGKQGADFLRFREENSYWLEDYCLYRALKDKFGGAAWYDWPPELRGREPSALGQARAQNSGEILFYAWLQWRLFCQFKAAKEYANSRGISLKGDLPILVSRDSADVWQHQESFKLQFAAGAPPDMYCALGQRWGMPTNNWEGIAADNFQYLKRRLRYAENFYDLLRIDHVVGLFRIWSIPFAEPRENQGLNGFFDPADQAEWEGHGRRILQVMAAATKMRLCAEDLGVIPRCCTDTLRQMGIPGNEVQRWVKDWQVSHDFLSPQQYRQVAVAMLSTHDTTNWMAWWENEAGTVDEEFFRRLCAGRVDCSSAKAQLFDAGKSRYGRLRWRAEISSVERMLIALGRERQEAEDFARVYLDTFGEKERLWARLGLKGPMREQADKEILAAAHRLTLDSASEYTIELITDWLMLCDGLYKGDPYQFRVNTPGTVSDKNWSQTLPLSLEGLLKHPVCSRIRKMVEASGRG
jgi:4-alpha-glucanotransferase